MKQIVINIKDQSKLGFFAELIGNLDFVEIASPPKAQLKKEIAQSIKEVNLMRAGKLSEESLDDLITL